MLLQLESEELVALPRITRRTTIKLQPWLVQTYLSCKTLAFVVSLFMSELVCLELTTLFHN